MLRICVCVDVLDESPGKDGVNEEVTCVCRRVFVVGQSRGGMRSFYLAAHLTHIYTLAKIR